MSLPQLALLAALSFTAGTVYLVHHSQSADREVRGPPLPLGSARAGIFIGHVGSLNSIHYLQRMRYGVKADLERQRTKAENLRLLREQQELQKKLEKRSGAAVMPN